MKQDKKKAIVIMMAMIVVLTASLLLFFVCDMGAGVHPRYTEDNLPKLNNEEVSNKPDATSGDAVSEQPPAEENTGTEYSEEDTSQPQEDSTDFEVPETSLPDVSLVEGNDWFDKEKFEPVGPVADSYFDKTVFIGDSRTEGLALYGGQKNMNTFSYKGLSVDKVTTEKCIPLDGENYTVEEAIERTDYQNYYIQFGINELGWIYVSKFADDVSSLIDVIFRHNPDAVVYVSSIVPVTKELSDQDDVFNLTNVQKFNDSLYEMCQERGDVIYLDVGASVSDEAGYLPKEATTDGRHCNVDYCKRMIKYIRTHAVQKVVQSYND